MARHPQDIGIIKLNFRTCILAGGHLVTAHHRRVDRRAAPIAAITAQRGHIAMNKTDSRYRRRRPFTARSRPVEAGCCFRVGCRLPVRILRIIRRQRWCLLSCSQALLRSLEGVSPFRPLSSSCAHAPDVNTVTANKMIARNLPVFISPLLMNARRGSARRATFTSLL